MNFAQKMVTKLKEKSDKLTSTQFDLLQKIRVAPEIQKERMDICLSCDKLYRPTSSCKVCGCFMQLKTWMPDQKCPIDKWGTHEASNTPEQK